MKKKRTITKNRSSYKKSKRKNSRKKTNKKSRTRTLKKKELLKIITSLTAQKKRSKRKKSRKKRTQRKGKRGGAISGVQQATEGTGAFGPPQVIPPPPPGGIVVPPAPVPEGTLGISAQADPPPLGVGAPQPGISGFGVPAPGPQQDDDEDVELGPGPAWQQVQQQYNPDVLSNKPVLGFGGPQAEVDDPTPAYERDWGNLSEQEKAQAEELEFTDDSWPTQTPNWVEWDNLGESQLAAEGLGFTEELWKGLQFEVGETVDRRNEGSPWMQGIVTNIIPLLVTISSSGDGEGIRWADVKKKQTQRSPVPSTLGYEKSWENLNDQERLGAQALDWDETTWESGIAPPNYVEWGDLSGDKITAAEDLGFTQESWDNLKTKFSWSQGEKKIEVDDDDDDGDEGEDVSDTSLPTTEKPKWTSLVTVKRKDPEGEKGKKGESTWGKLKGVFKGTEYEQFIEQSGLELKNLFSSYLTEYFQDIQKGEGVDVLRAKYESFIDAYYKEAIAKDKQLIQKLKDV